MRVLLIEDDSATAQSIELMLKSESFNTYTTDLGEEGIDLGKLYDYDIILLDLNLPDMSGYEVLRNLRVAKVKTPILILSGMAGIEDKVKGLGFGADDYLTKPFGTGELLARVRANLRRLRQAEGQADAQPRFAFGEVEIDRAARTVLRAGEPVHLTPIEYRMLTVLAANAGRVMTQRQLLTEVWGPGHVDRSHYLRIHMGHLRRKLEADPAQPRHLLTETGVGYRLVVDAQPEGTRTPSL